MDDGAKGTVLGRLALVPPLAVALLVWLLGSDVPYWDDWDLVPILSKAKRGAIGFADYFALYGVHRFVLPKFVLTHVALATGWNVRAQLLLNLGVVCLTLLAVARIAGPAHGTNRGALALLGSSLALFSLAQYDNFLWGGQIGYFLTIALVVWAIAALATPAQPPWTRIAVAAALCFLASFSIGFGIVSWVALAPLVWVRTPRHRAAALAAWAILAILCASLYAAGAHFPIDGSPERAGPLEIVLFFVAVAGTPWTSLAAPALALGAASLALFAALAARAIRAGARAAMPWISLGLVALGFAGLTAIVRARIGWEVADSPRYATPMLLLVVATIHLASAPSGERRRVSPAAILVALLLLANVTFLPLFWSTAAARRVNRTCTDLAFVLGAARADCVPAAGPQADLEGLMRRARDERLRPFADRSWFSAIDLPARDLRVDRARGSIRMRG
ncbi:MAG TPA: hypothetical protein VGF40_10795, partial [Thermoanaerobaculia bacterium]